MGKNWILTFVQCNHIKFSVLSNSLWIRLFFHNHRVFIIQKMSCHVSGNRSRLILLMLSIVINISSNKQEIQKINFTPKQHNTKKIYLPVVLNAELSLHPQVYTYTIGKEIIGVWKWWEKQCLLLSHHCTLNLRYIKLYLKRDLTIMVWNLALWPNVFFNVIYVF